jgi:hypothetical protein
LTHLSRNWFDQKEIPVREGIQNIIHGSQSCGPNLGIQTQGYIFVHEKWAGISAKDKIQWVLNKVDENKGDGCLFTDLS